MCINTNQADTELNPNHTAKQHTVVIIHLNTVTCLAYPQKFTRYNVIAPFLPTYRCHRHTAVYLRCYSDRSEKCMEIVYDVHLPDAKFRKSSPGQPAVCLCIARSVGTVQLSAVLARCGYSSPVDQKFRKGDRRKTMYWSCRTLSQMESNGFYYTQKGELVKKNGEANRAAPPPPTPPL